MPSLCCNRRRAVGVINLSDASKLLQGQDIFRTYNARLEARRTFLMGLSQRRIMLSRLRL